MTLTHDIERVEGAGARVDLTRPTAVDRPRRVRHRGRRWALVAAAATAWSLWEIGVGREEIVNSGGVDQLLEFFAAAATPELDPAFLRITWDAALVTVGYAVLGSVLSVAIGLVLGLVGSDAWRLAGDDTRLARVGQGALRACLVPARAVHEAVYAIVLVNILGLNPLVAILAIGLPFGAVTARVFANTFDDTASEHAVLLRSSGASRSRIVLYALLPAAARDLATYGFYRFECSIRAAAVLGVIGAGGLGFQIKLSFQSLEYHEMWTLIYALVILSGLADWWSSAVRRADAGRRRVGGGGPRRFVVGSVVVAAVAAVASWIHLGVDLSTLWAERAVDAALRFARESLPPEAPEGLGALVSVSLDTLAMSIVSAVVAFGLAVLAAPLSARPSRAEGTHRPSRWLRVLGGGLVRVWLLFLRAIPPPVWALLLLFVFFPGAVPAALALAVYNTGVLGRLLAELVENADRRPAAVLRASGASGVQIFLYERLPRLAPGFASLGLYRWEVTIRETVVVGLVAAGGLGYVLGNELAAFDFQAVTGTVLALVVITAAVDLVSGRIRRTLH